MPSADKALAEARRVVADERYGYKLGGWGTKDGTQAYGVDCRGFVKMCLDAGGFPSGGYTWTGDMRERMTSVGWAWHDGTEGAKAEPFAILLHTKRSGEKTGHTAVCAGGTIYEAWHDYDGVAGDGGGREVRRRSWYDYPWDGYLTYPSDATTTTTNTKGTDNMADWFFVQGKSDAVYLVTSDGKLHGLKSMTEYNYLKWAIEQAIKARQSGEVLHLRVDSEDSGINGGTYQTGAFLKMLKEILGR